MDGYDISNVRESERQRHEMYLQLWMAVKHNWHATCTSIGSPSIRMRMYDFSMLAPVRQRLTHSGIDKGDCPMLLR